MFWGPHFLEQLQTCDNLNGSLNHFLFAVVCDYAKWDDEEDPAGLSSYTVCGSEKEPEMVDLRANPKLKQMNKKLSLVAVKQSTAPPWIHLCTGWHGA